MTWSEVLLHFRSWTANLTSCRKTEKYCVKSFPQETARFVSFSEGITPPRISINFRMLSHLSKLLVFSNEGDTQLDIIW